MLRTAEEIDVALVAAGDRSAAVELVGDLHTDKNNKPDDIADIVAHVMLPSQEVDRKAMKKWIWIALRESVTLTPVVWGPDGEPLIELEARPSTIPGLPLRRWIVRAGAEPRIRGLQLRDTSHADRYVVIHRSTKPGYDTWQASWFDDQGAGGDLSSRTLEKAMMDGAGPSHHTIEVADVIGARANPQDLSDAIEAAALADLKRILSHLSDYDNTFTVQQVLQAGGTSEGFGWLRRQKYIAARPPRARWGMTEAGWDWLGPLGVGRRYAGDGWRRRNHEENTVQNPSPRRLRSLADVVNHVTTPEHVRETIEDMRAEGKSIDEIARWLVGDIAADGTRADVAAARAYVEQVIADLQRSNPAGDAHASKAAAMFHRFHTRDWRAEGSFHPSLVIPAELRCLGDALNTDYQSDKLHPGTGEDEGWIDYTHKHDGGVKIYAPVGARHPGDAAVVRTPAAVARVDQLTWLGKYLGGSYRAGGRVLEVRGSEPLPELFAAPSGKALFVVQGKRSLLFVLWGGRLAVERRGIVH